MNTKFVGSNCLSGDMFSHDRFSTSTEKRHWQSFFCFLFLALVFRKFVEINCWFLETDRSIVLHVRTDKHN